MPLQKLTSFKRLPFRATVSCFIILVSCTASSDKEMLQPESTVKLVKLDPIDAMNAPSKHAWDLFRYVNHPAKDYHIARRVMDSTKSIGAEGIVVWETWKHAGTEVFLTDGRTPPSWEDFSLDPYLSKTGKTFEASTSVLLANVQKAFKEKPQALTETVNDNVVARVTQEFIQHTQFDFNPKDGLKGQGGETRMNKNTFDFIVKNDLYNLDGVFAFSEKYLKEPIGKRKAMAFEKKAIEVKGMWRKLPDDELTKGFDKTYYVATDSAGAKYGLTSLHIITKEVPNWFWCSFRHKAGPTPEVPSVDDYGQPEELKGTFWENYELSGTQTSFTDSRGLPIKLSYPNIEDTFQQSSCITCHSTATIGKGLMFTEKGQMLFLRSKVYAPGKPGETIGTPKMSWYGDVTDPESYVQTDFVFSIPFRAHRKK